MTVPYQQSDLPRDDALWRTAMDFVLALNTAPAAPLGLTMVRAQAEAWCNADPRHAKAFAEAERIWALAGSIPPRYRHRWPARMAPRQIAPSRRQMLAGGAVALAASAVGVAVLPQAMHWLRGDSITGAAETRQIELPDGNRITLGPRSAMRMLDKSDRHAHGIELLHGLAFLELRPSRDGSIMVQAGLLSLSAATANFELRHDDDATALTVQQGVVELDLDLDTGRKRLTAGEWLALQAGRIDNGHTDPQRAGQWRDGILTVENRPVRAVAAEIARWHRGRVLLLDDSLGQRQVSGVFDLTQPEAALRAMLKPFGGRLRTVSPWLALIDIA